MTRCRLALGLVVAAVAAPLAVAAAEQAPIDARPTILRWGEAATLSGRFPGTAPGTVVTIQGKGCGVPASGFRDLRETRVESGGVWSAQIGATITTVFRAVAGKVTSEEVTIRARPPVQIRQRARNRFDVGVRAVLPFWHRRVQVQRLDRRLGTWTTPKTVVLDEQAGTGFSVWSSVKRPFRLVVPKGTTLRAVLPLSQARPCYLAGYSNIIRT